MAQIADPNSLNKTNTGCLIILSAVALTIALIYTKPVLIPLTIAIFLSSIICALIQKLSCYVKLPYWANVSLGVFLACLLFASFSWLIYYAFFIFKNHVEVHQVHFQSLYKSLLLSLGDFDVNIDSIVWELENLPFMKYARSVTGSLFNVVGNFVLVIAFSLFLITGALHKKTKTTPLFSEINEKISVYASAKLLMSLFTGLTVGLILFAFDVKLALVLGVVTVVLNFIPAVGAIIATLVPIPFLVLQFGIEHNLKILFILAIVGSIQLLIGNLIEPKFYGESLDLHPITILVCLIFWGLVWGIPGMFLAVPITGALKIILNRIPMTKPISEAFSGRFV